MFKVVFEHIRKDLKNFCLDRFTRNLIDWSIVVLFLVILYMGPG